MVADGLVHPTFGRASTFISSICRAPGFTPVSARGSLPGCRLCRRSICNITLEWGHRGGARTCPPAISGGVRRTTHAAHHQAMRGTLSILHFRNVTMCENVPTSTLCLLLLIRKTKRCQGFGSEVKHSERIFVDQDADARWRRYTII